MNTHFFVFLKLFGHPSGISQENPGHPAQKFGFAGFRRIYQTFWHPPVHVENPHPTGRYPDPKVWVGALFLVCNELLILGLSCSNGGLTFPQIRGLGPFRPKVGNGVESEFPGPSGLPAPGSKTLKAESTKSQKGLFFNSFSTCLTLFRLCF